MIVAELSPFTDRRLAVSSASPHGAVSVNVFDPQEERWLYALAGDREHDRSMHTEVVTVVQFMAPLHSCAAESLMFRALQSITVTKSESDSRIPASARPRWTGRFDCGPCALVTSRVVTLYCAITQVPLP